MKTKFVKSLRGAEVKISVFPSQQVRRILTGEVKKTDAGKVEFKAADGDFYASTFVSLLRRQTRNGFGILAGIRAEIQPKIQALRSRHDTLDRIGATLNRAEKSEGEHYATAHASLRGKGKADKLSEGELSALGYNAENWKDWN